METKILRGGAVTFFLLLMMCSCQEQSVQNTNKTASMAAADSMTVPKVGERLVDIQMQNATGEMVNLSQYVGKDRCLLVDCWASWCAPCLAEMPSLKKFYNNHHSKGFGIIGISFDSDQGQWLDAIRGLNLSWPQMSDLKGWGSRAAKIYGISSLPHTMLLNKDGKIIAIGLRGDSLFRKVEQQLQ
jgi:peroxiredoxin